MRWALVKVCVAVTTMVVVAFAVPLVLPSRRWPGTAPSRTPSGRPRPSRRRCPSPPTGTSWSPGRRLRRLGRRDGRRRTYRRATAPRRSTSDGSAPPPRTSRPHAASAGPPPPRSPAAPPCSSPPPSSSGEIAVVEVYVPESEVSNGVGTAWRRSPRSGSRSSSARSRSPTGPGVRMVQPAQRLVEGAHELGEGKLGARVPEEGPNELPAGGGGVQLDGGPGRTTPGERAGAGRRSRTACAPR